MQRSEAQREQIRKSETIQVKNIDDILNSISFQCYYLGGTEDAATGILGEMSKPLSWGMPVEKVCEKLKKKDKQICELRYGNNKATGFELMNLTGCSFSRETNRFEERRPEKAEGERPEKDLERLGRNLRRLLGKGRLYQADRGAQAQIRP